MKWLPLAVVFCAALPCGAQTPCSAAASADAARRAKSLQERLKRSKVEEMETTVPAAVRDQLTQLKDALSCTADAVLAQAAPSAGAAELQHRMAHLLNANQHANQHANQPEPPPSTVISKDGHEALGPYGDDLSVRVIRPSNVAGILAVEFSVNVQGGQDHLLLLYALHNGAWREQIRWQAPPLKQISDAFGDFFVSGALSTSAGEDSKLRVVVAHGTPWCTSRFSGFRIDVLSPGSGYSRAGFDPTFKSSGDTFELRVNDSAFDIESFERRVIYRYRIDEHDEVRRMEPIAINARGFVEEWLSAPWSESQAFSAPEAASVLKQLHDQFDPPMKSDTEFVTHGYGAVRACDAPGIFQVQISSTLERMVPARTDISWFRRQRSPIPLAGVAT
jgi:hypothetical protein